jgi:hypothetical protein
MVKRRAAIAHPISDIRKTPAFCLGDRLPEPIEIPPLAAIWGRELLTGGAGPC